MIRSQLPQSSKCRSSSCKGNAITRSPRPDFNLWQSGLGKKKNVTLKLYPDLNHLFAEGVGKSTPAEYSQPVHVSAKVVTDIASWIETLR